MKNRKDPAGEARQQGVSNRPLDEERREQEKIGPRDDRRELDRPMPVDETQTASTAQGSAGKTGTRSGARKHASANRGGITPGKARTKAGAEGLADRPPTTTVRAKRGTTQAPSTKTTSRPKSPRRAA